MPFGWMCLYVVLYDSYIVLIFVIYNSVLSLWSYRELFYTIMRESSRGECFVCRKVLIFLYSFRYCWELSITTEVSRILHSDFFRHTCSASALTTPAEYSAVLQGSSRPLSDKIHILHPPHFSILVLLLKLVQHTLLSFSQLFMLMNI